MDRKKGNWKGKSVCFVGGLTGGQTEVCLSLAEEDCKYLFIILSLEMRIV